MNSVCEYLMLCDSLSGKGTANVVRIGFSGSGSAGYYHREFVEKCIAEMDRVMVRVATGLEKATPLETLAIQLLMDSAYLKGNEDFDSFIERHRHNMARMAQQN